MSTIYKNYYFSNFIGREIRFSNSDMEKGDFITLRYRGVEKTLAGDIHIYGSHCELSDADSIYESLKFEIELNLPNFENGKFGLIDGDIAIIKNQFYDDVIKSAGFSIKKSLDLLSQKNLIIDERTSDGKINHRKVKSIDGKSFRCVFLKLDYEVKQ